MDSKEIPPLAITNWARRATSRSPLILLEGNNLDSSSPDLTVLLLQRAPRGFQDQTQSHQDDIHVSDEDPLPVTTNGSRFKTLALLKPGENYILFTQHFRGELDAPHAPNAADAVICITLTPAADMCGSPSPRIRLVLLECSDSPEQVPDDTLERLRTAGLVIQCAASELIRRCMMKDGPEGFQNERKSWEWDVATATPTIIRIPSLTISKAVALGDENGGVPLWVEIVKHVQVPASPDTINVAVMNFSWWDDVAKRARAHTALGAGTLALFGGASMSVWPRSWRDVLGVFLDRRPVDRQRVFDDGCRGKVWALASTTIGAMLHELGHCLSLPHPAVNVKAATHPGGGIMGRGFDQLNRLFVFEEDGRVFNGKDEPVFDRSSAVRLYFHSAFNAHHGAVISSPLGSETTLEPQATPAPQPVAQALHGNAQFVLSHSAVLRSSLPLRHLAFYVNGDVTMHKEFLGDQRVFEWRIEDVASLRSTLNGRPGDCIKLSSIDDAGNIGTFDIKDV